MSRRFFVSAGLGLGLLAAFCVMHYLRQQSTPEGTMTEPFLNAAAGMERSLREPNEMHPYVESLCAALTQGSPGQIRNEMRLLAEYCDEHPGDLSDVLQSLSRDPAENSEMLRAFGEVLMKGRRQPVDELVNQTAAVWSQQNENQDGRRLGFALLAEISREGTNSAMTATR